jgi:HNH endonuclease
MAFNRAEADALLVACHRRCCICHRFCGVKMELHHIDPREASGDDSIENAIPLCFECHAEVQLYNPNHPRGRRFHEAELRGHKEQWLRICKESPGALLAPLGPVDVGPIQALIDELDFNAEIARRTGDDEIGALFLVSQFERAIQEGLFSLLPDPVRQAVSGAYATLMQANMYLQKMASLPWGGSGAWPQAHGAAQKATAVAQTRIPTARDLLLEHLGH